MASLCLLADLKAFIGITDSSEDTLLQVVLDGTSAAIKAYTGRLIESGTRTDEVHYGDGTNILLLDDCPISTLTSIEVGTDAVDSGDYELVMAAGEDGRVRKTAGVWTLGTRYLATYVSGYTTIPTDIRDACCLQAGYVYLRAKDGGGRLGDVGPINPESGSPGFLTGPWEPTALAMLQPHRSLTG